MSHRLSEGGVVYVTRVVSASLGNVLTHTALCCPVMRACDAPCMSAGTSACLVCSPHRVLVCHRVFAGASAWHAYVSIAKC